MLLCLSKGFCSIGGHWSSSSCYLPLSSFKKARLLHFNPPNTHNISLNESDYLLPPPSANPPPFPFPSFQLLILCDLHVFQGFLTQNFLLYLIPSCFSSSDTLHMTFFLGKILFFLPNAYTIPCWDFIRACFPTNQVTGGRKTSRKKWSAKTERHSESIVLMRMLLLLWSWLKSTLGADLDFLLSTLFNKLQHRALQALPCSHPPLIKACSHRDISPHRQCLFSRCCQVPFFTLISSLKLFFNPRTPCLPSFSFLCEGCQRWQLVAGRDLWEEKEGALLQRAAAWLHLTHAVTQNSLTRACTDSHTDKVTHPAFVHWQ